MRRGFVLRSRPVATSFPVWPLAPAAPLVGGVTPFGGRRAAERCRNRRGDCVFGGPALAARGGDRLGVGSAVVRRRAGSDDRALLRPRRPVADRFRRPGRVLRLHQLGLRRGRPSRRRDLSVARAPRWRGSGLDLDRCRDLRVDLRRHLLHGRAAGPRLAAVSLVCRPWLSRPLHPGLRRTRLARARLRRRFQRCRLARRSDRWVHRLRLGDRTRVGPRVAHLDRQLCSRRHQPRLPGRRCVAAGTDLLRVRALRLATESHVAPGRERFGRLRGGGLRLSRRARARHVSIRQLARPRLARRFRPDRCGIAGVTAAPVAWPTGRDVARARAGRHGSRLPRHRQLGSLPPCADRGAGRSIARAPGRDRAADVHIQGVPRVAQPHARGIVE